MYTPDNIANMQRMLTEINKNGFAEVRILVGSEHSKIFRVISNGASFTSYHTLMIF